MKKYVLKIVVYSYKLIINHRNKFVYKIVKLILIIKINVFKVVYNKIYMYPKIINVFNIVILKDFILILNIIVKIIVNVV